MPKKKKMSLSPIKIQSFITSLKKDEREKVRGGLPYSWYCTRDAKECPTDSCHCGTGSCSPNCTNTCGCTDTCETCGCTYTCNECTVETCGCPTEAECTLDCLP